MDSMPTSIQANSKGLSLVEILVALTLISLVVVSVAKYVLRDDKDILGEASTTLERALRFTAHESILRNAVVRLKIHPEKNPVEYAVEFGPADAFVLPEFSKKWSDEGNLSLKDIEERNKTIEKISQKFNKVQEFQKEDQKLDSSIRVIGVVTSSRPSLVNDTEVDFYVYPNGEKDGGLIILSTGKEMGVLEVEPLTEEIKQRFFPIEAKGEEQIEIFERQKAKELFEQWKRS